jgi:hypothetical protein
MEVSVTAKPASVYDCIAAVMDEIGKTGISKDRKNQQQGYNFRGIDDVYNALAPILAKHRLVILPRTMKRECVERTTQKGSALFYVTVDMEFDFVSAADNSTHVVRMSGEAMDSADKATNKAQSAAYKYACMQTFCIPTEGNNDADAVTHDPIAAKPDAYAEWLADLEAVADEGYDTLVSTISKSSEPFRARLKSEPAKWQALKARAEKAKAA